MKKVMPKAVPKFTSTTEILHYQKIQTMNIERTYKYKARQIQDYTTVVGGFLNITDFLPKDKKLRKAALLKLMPYIADSTATQNVYFYPPEVPEGLVAQGLSSVNLSVRVVNAKGQTVEGGGEPRVVTYKVGAKDPSGAAAAPTWTSTDKIGGSYVPIGQLAFSLSSGLPESATGRPRRLEEEMESTTVRGQHRADHQGQHAS